MSQERSFPEDKIGKTPSDSVIFDGCFGRGKAFKFSSIFTPLQTAAQSRFESVKSGFNTGLELAGQVASLKSITLKEADELATDPYNSPY